MGRRRRSRGFDIEEAIRLVGALMILGILAGGTQFLSGAKTVAEVAASVAALVIVATVGIGLLCGIVILIVAIVRRSRAKPLPIGDAPMQEHFGSRTEKPTGDSLDGPPVPRFTWELLQALEWRGFERLVEGYFRASGFEADRVRAGADGGVDLIVRKPGEERPFALCQCKAWRTYTVGVKPVRELFGVMAAEGIRIGYFVATRDFTEEARKWAKYKQLKLVTGRDLLEKLNNLPEAKRTALFHQITAGDYTTPTCPTCDIKMMRREGKQGAFWGCRNFGRSKCRQTFSIREEEKFRASA